MQKTKENKVGESNSQKFVFEKKNSKDVNLSGSFHMR